MERATHFSTGQKVYIYYHFTFYFDPPGFGKIILRWPVRMKHHFAGMNGNKDGKCFWYVVKTTTGVFVLMPSPCIRDLVEYVESERQFLTENVDRVGKSPGDSFQAYMTLSATLNEAERYLK